LSSQTLRKNFDDEKRFITMQNNRNQEWFDSLKSIEAARSPLGTPQSAVVGAFTDSISRC